MHDNYISGSEGHNKSLAGRCPSRAAAKRLRGESTACSAGECHRAGAEGFRAQAWPRGAGAIRGWPPHGDVAGHPNSVGWAAPRDHERGEGGHVGLYNAPPQTSPLHKSMQSDQKAPGAGTFGDKAREGCVPGGLAASQAGGSAPRGALAQRPLLGREQPQWARPPACGRPMQTHQCLRRRAHPVQCGQAHACQP